MIRLNCEKRLLVVSLFTILWGVLFMQAIADDQRGSAVLGQVETYKAGDKPYTLTVDEHVFSTPYGYDREANTDLKYPLVVIGRWGEGQQYFNDAIQRKYPAFYLVYPHSSEPDGARLAELIDAGIGKGLRIDPHRILYTGFSAGGSGSFKLIRGMASEGMYFAAVNRIAGQSESVMEESATEKTALWLHIGLEDEPKRVEVSRALYNNLKQHPANFGAIETHNTDSVRHPGDPTKQAERNTWILTKDGVEVFRYSEYTGCGHEAWIGYSDPKLFEWIFGRAIK